METEHGSKIKTIFTNQGRFDDECLFKGDQWLKKDFAPIATRILNESDFSSRVLVGFDAIMESFNRR